LAALVLFVAAGVASAVETASGDLGVDVDFTWVSKYIWRGFDKLDDKAAFQPSINFDLYDSGWSVNVWYSTAGASGGGGTSTVNAEEFNYAVTYSDTICEGQAWETNYAASYVYYDFPDMASADADVQEVNLGLSWPEICPFGTVPNYTLVYMWDVKNGGRNSNYGAEGFIHVFGLGKALDVACLENPVNFTWDLTYNDGTGATTVDHDWSHTKFGLSTTLDGIGSGTLTPGIFYQISMDKSVNNENELWTGISYALSF
jgi:hypothetical protein